MSGPVTWASPYDRWLDGFLFHPHLPIEPIHPCPLCTNPACMSHPSSRPSICWRFLSDESGATRRNDDGWGRRLGREWRVYPGLPPGVVLTYLVGSKLSWMLLLVRELNPVHLFREWDPLPSQHTRNFQYIHTSRGTRPCPVG